MPPKPNPQTQRMAAQAGVPPMAVTKKRKNKEINIKLAVEINNPTESKGVVLLVDKKVNSPTKYGNIASMVWKDDGL